ncbi:DUF3325 domain-containing protein [Luteibacter sp. CQ10]|uniref:DUF3325 domain-containing protein n=1 Tax=Luteibacter sp. CQ10 TaxID=2805821 RepID=UPI0034A4538D
MIALCILAALAGFVGLSFGMTRHQRDVLGRTLAPSTSLRWRIVGWTGVALSLVLAAIRDGAALGTVYWLGELTVAALAVALGTTWRGSRRGASPVREPSGER